MFVKKDAFWKSALHISQHNIKIYASRIIESEKYDNLYYEKTDQS